MSNKKQLRIGLIGCGFMGRTHSNGYKRVGDFFPELQYQPVLKAVCARNPEKVKAFAEQWGYESTETDWRKLFKQNVQYTTKLIYNCRERGIDLQYASSASVYGNPSIEDWNKKEKETTKFR